MNSQSDTKTVKRSKPKRIHAPREQAALHSHLVQKVTKLTAEVEALQRRLAEIERSSQTHRVPQSLAELAPRRLPPPGQTAMGAIIGKLETDESLEELLSQLKASG